MTAHINQIANYLLGEHIISYNKINGFPYAGVISRCAEIFNAACGLFDLIIIVT